LQQLGGRIVLQNSKDLRAELLQRSRGDEESRSSFVFKATFLLCSEWPASGALLQNRKPSIAFPVQDQCAPSGL
jgi:hypothetical protein